MRPGDAEASDVLKVSRILHAFGADLDAQLASVCHQRLQDGALAGIARAAVHEGSICFDHVGPQGSQPVELADPGAQIVQSEAGTARAQPVHGVQKDRLVDHFQILCELDDHAVQARWELVPESSGRQGCGGGVDVERLP